MSIDKYETLNQERKIQNMKKKVAAYCRVSTDNDDQANSFESQQRYFRQYIERNPDWELYAIFADEGISGTNTKKRKEFNRMIACAKNGDFEHTEKAIAYAWYVWEKGFTGDPVIKWFN